MNMGFLGGLFIQIQISNPALDRPAMCIVWYQASDTFGMGEGGWVRICVSVHACVYPVSFQPVKRKSAVRSLRRWPWTQVALEGYVRRDPQQSDYQGEDFVVFSQPAWWAF